ncbi:MAG: LAGLIDADG family homing endonuclease, partial [Candidatus Odinarchaeota archaeon]
MVVWDTMSAFVPVSDEAVEEARRIMPSKMLFNPASHSVMYTPSNEMQVGLYMMSDTGKKTRMKFESREEAKKALREGKIGYNDFAHIGGVYTTLDRIKLDSMLPKSMRGGKLLKDPEYRFTKKEQNALFDKLARADPKGYPKAINTLKDAGNAKATYGSFSIGLDDLKVHKDIRDSVLKNAELSMGRSDVSTKAGMDKFVDVYGTAAQEMKRLSKKRAIQLSQKDSLSKLDRASGIKGDAYSQITASPVLFVDAKGQLVPSVVKKSFSEGLKLGDYWAASSGGRKGVVQKVQSVSEPGYMTKLMVNSTVNTLIQDTDCGTKRGISLSLDEPDIVGRYLANPLKLGRTTIPAGTIMTPELVSKARNYRVNKVITRSPMKCEHADGICAKCAGLNENGNLLEKGSNVGIVAAQAIGERGTQMAMKSFHCLHQKSLVTVRPGRGALPLMISMEDLFELVDSPAETDEWGEFKRLTSSDGWLMMDGDGWTSLMMVRRHEQTRPMVMISDESAVTICQDNHPIAVWEMLPEERIGGPGFLSPIEIEAKRWYGGRQLLPPYTAQHKKGLDLNPYFVGAYLAEGSIGYRWTNPNNRVKKPYSITLSQEPGPISDSILKNAHNEWNVQVKGSKIEIHSLQLGRQFKELFGHYSNSVSLPPDFIHYEKNWLADCICGLIDGDGTAKHDTDGADRITIDTTSFELAQQVVAICARLGIASNLLVTASKELTRHQGFRVVLRITESAKALLKSSIKVASVKKCSPEGVITVNGKCLITNVRSVPYTGDFVYDVKTESSTFTAGGLLNHNSGGIYEGREAAEKSIAGGGFDRALTLLTLPKKVKGAATLSTESGRVQQIRKDPAGGWKVKVNG